MAKAVKTSEKMAGEQHLGTSIGRGPRSKPSNKSKRASWKKYRGQGK